ncbi:MAG: VWA domain-containing protein [Wenzhouxiangellaceae bacterium]
MKANNQHIEQRPGTRRRAWPTARMLQRTTIVFLMLLLIACGAPRDNNRAVVVLVDISREYATEMEKARTLTNYLLGSLTSGDSIAIAFIDNSSFSERNFIARADFDHRPSVTTRQKHQVRAELDAFMARFSVPSAHSDITGGVLLARDFLKARDAGHHVLFVLSDLREDLMPNLKRDMQLDLEGVQVVAVNVTRQRSDNFDPESYRNRLAQWQRRVEDSGGEWQLANDLARLDDLEIL